MTDQKKKKKEINWISFYLFAIQWVNIKMNISSWYYITYYLVHWLMGIRLAILVITVLVLVLGMNIGALLFAVKLLLVYLVMEILVIIILHQVYKDDGVYDEPYNKLSTEQQLLFKNLQGARYADALSSYKDMLKREKNAQN